MLLFLPVGTTRPRLRVPFVTYALIAANAAVFGAALYLKQRPTWLAFVPALHYRPF